MNSSMPLEKFLQRWRFKKAIPYLHGRVLDFGGNKGELGYFAKTSSYEYVNNIFDVHGLYDSIACLAVLEHMNFALGRTTLLMLATHLYTGGKIVITTPSKILHPILRFLAWWGLLDKQNIAEHTRYWTREEFYIFKELAKMEIKYSRFQFGLNQLIILRKP